MLPLSVWAASCIVLGLRIAPVLAFAPPFTLTQMPRTFRVLFGFALSVSLVSTFPKAALLPGIEVGPMALAAIRELGLGFMFVLAFQIVFGALYVAGRTIDIQAGYGLALLIDPASQSQTPLVGTLFAYAAGAVFFAFDGHIGLLRMLAASLTTIPLGSWVMPDSAERIAAFLSTVFLLAFGVAGGSVLVLFLIDISLALLSRTVPQMNVLILGFQVKTIVLFLVSPSAFGIGGALLVRLMAITLEAIPRLV